MSENTTEYSSKHHHHHHHHHDCGCPQGVVQEDAILDVKGLKHILGKLCDKILLAVGVIHANGELPLHLWREYEKHGVVVKGKIDEVTEEQDGYLTKEDYQKFLEALEEITKLWAEINDKINPAIKDLQDIVNTQGQQINTINSEISTINETLEELQSTVSKQGADIETINTSLANLSASLTSLQGSALTSVSANGTSPLSLSASKSGTSVTIGGSISAATTSSAGTMSATDKTRLDNLYSAYQNGELGSGDGGMTEEQAKELAELWEKYQNGDFTGGTTSTGVTVSGSYSIGSSVRLVTGTISADSQMSFASTPSAGHETHVILRATAAVTITLSGVTAPDGNTSISVPSGKYVEINFISDGSTIYARSAVQE